jgi:hypothetical protein
MSTALTEADKEKIRYHLGYLASGFAATLQFGLPRPYQTVFMVEQAMMLLNNAYAITRLRDILCTLEKIEKKMVCDLDTLKVESVDTVKMRGDVIDRYEGEYKRWASRVADILGVPKYPFSERSGAVGGPGSIVKVSG